jgi:hypothetical protein
MRILAFDPSKSTGWCCLRHHARTILGHTLRRLADAEWRRPLLYTETRSAEGTRAHQGARQAGFRRARGAIAGQDRRDQRGRNDLSVGLATAAIVATLANFGVIYGTIPPGTWRKMFFGERFKPPVDKKNKNDWKAAAVAMCERHGITLAEPERLSPTTPPRLAR